MKQRLRTTTVRAALIAVAALAMPISQARADFCRNDFPSGMRICGFSSMDQCRAMISGRGGICIPNPFPAPAGMKRADAKAEPHKPERLAAR
jgi:hypothetical protein